MEIRKVTCDVKDCCEEYQEEKYGAGFPGWGSINGLQNPDTGQSIAHLCPRHLIIISKSLNGGNE